MYHELVKPLTEDEPTNPQINIETNSEIEKNSTSTSAKKTYKDDLKKVKEFLKTLDATKLNKARGIYREHQLKIVDLIKEVVPKIEEAGFHPILAGGSLMGAVRHGGFIPWDDDFDMDMFRDEFDNFEIWLKENYLWIDSYQCKSFDEHRELLDNALKENPDTIIFSKKLTCISAYKGTSLEDCITIDFFPREYINPKLDYKSYKKYWKKHKRTLQKPKNWKTYFDKANKEIYTNTKIYQKESSLTATGWGNDGFRHATSLSILPIDAIKPYARISFEGVEMFAYKEIDKYLTGVYGSYMNIPATLEIAKYIETYDNWLKKHNRKYYLGIKQILEEQSDKFVLN